MDHASRRRLVAMSFLITALVLTAAWLGPARGRQLHPPAAPKPEPATISTDAVPVSDQVAAIHRLEQKAQHRREVLAVRRIRRERRAVRARRREIAATAAVQSASRQQRPATTASYGSPQAIAAAMLPAYGWSSSQMGCLDSLWTRESGWSVTAENPSGAYGIPQALPGSKMAAAGAGWQTDPATQIHWGLGYIQAAYGSPCGAWDHELAAGWY